MTKQEFLQVAEWIADGVCEFESFYGTWVGPEKKWTISMDDSFSSFRRKPQPAPPVYRAWKPEEVPIGAWVRLKLAPGYWTTIMGVAHDGDVMTFEHEMEDAVVTCKKLFTDSEYSADKGKTWHPCGVLTNPETSA